MAWQDTDTCIITSYMYHVSSLDTETCIISHHQILILIPVSSLLTVVRTWSLDNYPRVSTGEASGAGFEKVRCLFSYLKIARPLWDMCLPWFPKVRDVMHIQKAYKMTEEWVPFLIFPPFYLHPNFEPNPKKGEKVQI